MRDSLPSTTVPRHAPLRHLIVLAHPDRRSFCGQIADSYADQVSRHGQEAVVRDLYGIGFNPVLAAGERPGHASALADDVARELTEIARCDTLVLVYPIWFGLPPAMLKGYVDRVMGAGYSFRDVHERTGQRALAGKPLLSFTTSGTSLAWLHEQGQVLSLREIFDVYLWQGFGMSRSEHVTIDSVVPNMSTRYADEQLLRVRETATRACALIASERHAAEADALLH